MSHYTYLTAPSKSADLTFDSLPALNADLQATTIQELLEYNSVQTDFIKLSNKSITFWDRESETYQPKVNVYSCIGINVLKKIAAHITKGKLLIQLDHEADKTPKSYVLSPNKVERFKAQDFNALS